MFLRHPPIGKVTGGGVLVTVGLSRATFNRGPWTSRVSSRSGFTSGLTQGWWLLCGQIKCRNQTGYGEDPIRATIPRNDRSSFWCWRPTLYSSGWALIHSTATCSALWIPFSLQSKANSVWARIRLLLLRSLKPIETKITIGSIGRKRRKRKNLDWDPLPPARS